MKRVLVAVVLVVVGCLTVTTAPAAAVDKLVTFTSDGPGPESLDQVYAHQIGPKRAERVLVLMPGTPGGAGDFTLLARDLVKRVDDLQVWAIDRRSQALEDTSVFAQALDGQKSLQEMFDYYLGWVTNGGTPADHFDFLDARRSRSLASGEWRWRSRRPQGRARGIEEGPRGDPRRPLARRLADRRLRRLGLQRQARLQGRRGPRADRRRSARQLRRLRPRSGPGADRRAREPRTRSSTCSGIGIPEAAGLFAEVGGVFARLDPTGAGDDAPELPVAAGRVQAAACR